MSAAFPTARLLRAAVAAAASVCLLGATGCAQVPPEQWGRSGPTAVSSSPVPPSSTVPPSSSVSPTPQPFAAPLTPATASPAALPSFGPPSASAPTLPGALPVPTTSPAPAATPPPETKQPTTPVNCAKRKCLALTFDDGPMPETKKLLDVLKKQHVTATFFVTGQQAKAHPGVLRRMVAEGHVIGNHSFSHPQFWKISAEGVKSQLSRTTAAIRKATGKKVTVFRPPYGESNARIRSIAGKQGLCQILWSVDSLDWRSRNAQAVTQRVLKAARPGAIVLSHDIYPSTRKAWAALIPKLKKKGYVFVTVPQLLGSRIKPGRTFSQR